MRNNQKMWICRWVVAAAFWLTVPMAIGEEHDSLTPRSDAGVDAEIEEDAATTEPAIDADELLDLSLEELMNIEVITTSRTRGQSLFNSPAAIFVITQDDIQRSGHKHLPELLRMVPGIHVARIDANKWSVASRGFSQRFNSTLLVQMDGRTLYTPGFSGVIWSIQDTPLQDIERIEVVRGPGASLWGSNAVNGIINIVTKSARDTQGVYVEAGTGTHEGPYGTIRYGDAIGDAGAFRIYAKGNQHDRFETVGPPYSDDWWRGQAGFRMISRRTVIPSRSRAISTRWRPASRSRTWMSRPDRLSIAMGNMSFAGPIFLGAGRVRFPIRRRCSSRAIWTGPTGACRMMTAGSRSPFFRPISIFSIRARPRKGTPSSGAWDTGTPLPTMTSPRSSVRGLIRSPWTCSHGVHPGHDHTRGQQA
jgi:outer membrane receptor protein involved in Fe transport